jgi:hypothetical protein
MLFRFFTLATLIGLAQACGLIQHLFSSDSIDGKQVRHPQPQHQYDIRF